MALTLVAAVWPRLQGIVLTAEFLAFFIAVMVLMPKAWPTWTASLNAGFGSPITGTGIPEATPPDVPNEQTP
jgi:hypothetical protein